MLLKITARLGWTLGVVGLVLALSAGDARAQYRDNGISFEAGAETYEFMPYTVGAFAASELAWYGWRKAGSPGNDAKAGPFKLREFMKPCSARKPYGFPCQNNWFGLTDGIYGGIAYQRVLGDLLLDLSESPILKNLVVTYRGLVGMAGTLAGGGKLAPVFYTHQEPGIRWNILDENIRPYIAMNAGLNVFVDVGGFVGRLQNNNAACTRADGNEELGGSATCVAGASQGSIGLNTFSPSAGLFYLTSFPAMGSLRPEAGVEWFFTEDISLQVFASPVLYGTILPQFILRAPAAGFSVRGGGTVVVYW